MSDEQTRIMIRKYAKARNKYRPKRIRLLFIAESPPSSGGFFYFERTIGKDHLFRDTMKALQLWPENERMGKDLDKRELLRQFRSKGFFLIDTCQSPVDKLPHQDRRRAILSAIPRVIREVSELDPENIVIVKSTIFRPVRDALERSGLRDRILNKEPLPFPSHGNQRIFRRELRHLLGVS